MQNKKISMNNVLIVISVLAFICILLRQFVLHNTPEWFSWGEELGELLYDACVGYLVTFWFYFLTVYKPEMEHKKRAKAVVSEFTRRIVQEYESLIEDFDKQYASILSTMQIEKGSKQELEAYLKLINPSGPSPRLNNLFIQMSWADLLLNQRNQIDRFLRETTLVYNRLEPHQNEIIAKMISHRYLELIRNIPLVKFQDVSFLAEDMWDFSQLVRELKSEFVH